MKRITLLITIAAGFSAAVAQQKPGITNNPNQYSDAVTGNHKLKTENIKSSANQNSKKNGSNTINTAFWNDDFSTPANWVIANETGNTDDWVIGTNGPSGSFAIAAITSTSAANGFALFDSDLLCSGDQIANLTTASSINCTGKPIVKISFQQYYRRFYDSTYVYVSNDNVNWTPYSVNTLLANNQFSANNLNKNPDTVVVDITPTAGGQATVWIRFQFYSPSSFGANAGCGYAWMVDDVELFEPASVDAGVSQIVAPVSDCATNGAAPVTVRIKNYGGSALTNLSVSMKLNGGTPVTETVAGPINAGDSLDYTFTATANLGTNGLYTIEAYTAASGDGNPANDNTIKSIQSGAFPVSSSNDFNMGFEAGEDLSLWGIEDTDGDGITFDLPGTLAHTGNGCLRAPYSANLAATTDNWLFTSCLDLQAGTNYSLQYWYKVFDVASVSYSIESKIGSAQNSASMTQSIATDPTPPDTAYAQSLTSFSVATSGTYYIGFHIYGSGIQNSFRLDDINVSVVTAVNNIDDNSSLISLYPSPASNQLTVSLDATIDNAGIEIYNATGSLVKSVKNAEGEVKVDVSSLAKGIYTLKVTAGSKMITKRFSVAR